MIVHKSIVQYLCNASPAILDIQRLPSKARVATAGTRVPLKQATENLDLRALIAAQ